jgi:hypothetical protein
VVEERRVHDAEARHEAGRCDRDQLDEQAGAGRERHGVADLRVARAVKGEQPDEEQDHGRDVSDRVVDVGRLDEQRVGEHEALDRDLARQVHGPLDVPQPAASPHRAVDLHQRELAARRQTA